MASSSKRGGKRTNAGRPASHSTRWAAIDYVHTQRQAPQVHAARDVVHRRCPELLGDDVFTMAEAVRSSLRRIVKEQSESGAAGTACPQHRHPSDDCDCDEELAWPGTPF